LSKQDSIEVVAINDLFDNEVLSYLLQYDTIMGTFDKEVRYDDANIYVDGRPIQRTQIRNPRELPWKELEIDVVVEATGIFRARDQLNAHLEAGAKRVLLTVPPKDEIDAMVVIGVNDEILREDHRIVSNASCTTNCLAPISKVLDEAFGIVNGIMTTVHAYTNDQRLADVPHSDFRRSRAAAENIIPTTTGAARAVGKVLPHLNGKLDGMAARVPVADGSIVDLTLKLLKSPTREELNAVVKEAAAGPLANILEYSETAMVSSDIIGNPHSCIFDSLVTQANGDGYARVLCWYDNEWGYSNRCVDLIKLLAAFDA
jgi:glyceraldehyde 3-phosphate dehydrogenase